MASSPRKSAPRAGFTQTWNDTDTASLDPTSLPIARLPRGWERKQETKTTSKGKQKKVWRRYTTRASVVDAADDEDEQEEGNDARARVVKKLQRMSPGAMEKSTRTLHGVKRAFKATRWDRRKSVLPRKKLSAEERVDETPEDATESDTQPYAPEINGASSLDRNTPRDEYLENISEPISEYCLRRSRFTLSIDSEPFNSSKGEIHETSVVQGTSFRPSEPQTREDEIISIAFRSPGPINPVFLVDHNCPNDDSEYPESVKSPVAFNASLGEIREQGTSRQIDDISDGNISAADIRHDIISSKSQQWLSQEDKGIDDCEGFAIEGTVAQQEETPCPSLLRDFSVDSRIEASTLPDRQIALQMEPDPHTSERREEAEDDVELHSSDELSNEEFTEASLQLNLQRELGLESQNNLAEGVTPPLLHGSAVDDAPESTDRGFFRRHFDPFCEQNTGGNDQDTVPIVPETEHEDIAAGLSLSFSTPASREPSLRESRPRSPPAVEQGPDDATMTIEPDDDTAILKDFLSRAAASKASKTTSTSRRESLQNRRDSDVVRHALASPRKVLEDKDPNSPSKMDNEVILDLSPTFVLVPDLRNPASPTSAQVDGECVDDPKASCSRRSSRMRKSRLPAPASLQPAGPPKIAVRRADGGEPIVLKKSDAQELSLLTRANTRKNKQGSVAVDVRLLEIANEAAGYSEDSTVHPVQVTGKKCVRWDERLVYYQEGTDTLANMIADAESMATPDELSMPAPAATLKVKSKPKTRKDKNSTPKIRRVRGLGTANGTPGKGLLQPGLLLPDAVQEVKEAVQTQFQASRLAKPRVSKVKRMPVALTSNSSISSTSAVPLTAVDTKVPALDIAPVGIESTTTAEAIKERKSRLATPRKVKLPQLASAVPVEGKENQQRTSIAGATPKKGIPVPSTVVLPGVVVSGVETALPRRRARRL